MGDNTQGLVIHDRFPCVGRTTDPVFRAGLTADRLARFYAKVNRSSEGCWPWMGTRMPRGYGLFNGGRFDGRQRTRYAHRLMWELANGRRIRTGEVVRHTCDNPPCCNPSHLIIGTQAENVNDAAEQGKYVAAARQRWHNPDRHRLIQWLLTAPRGSMRRAASEHGIGYSALAVAVHRARKRQSALTHGDVSPLRKVG